MSDSFVVSVKKANKTLFNILKNWTLIVKTHLVHDGCKNPPYPNFSKKYKKKTNRNLCLKKLTCGLFCYTSFKYTQK